MPIIWRYLVLQYVKITSMCVLAFIAILLTMRFDEIAHFMALGAPIGSIFLFTLYQVPYILPIALPISTLIASFIQIQRLSSMHELTALRACGFGLKNILTPILLTALVLSLVNFWIVSEVSTQSHLISNTLKTELRSINPLLLLSNKHLMRMKGVYFEAQGASRVGEFASDVVLALPDKHHNRLLLLLAKRLHSTPTLFTGEGVTLISSFSKRDDQEEQFDEILIENMKQTETAALDFSSLLQKKVWTVNNDYLTLSLLLARIEEQRKALQEARIQKDETSIRELRGHLEKSLADISRRVSIAFAVLSFTLMGASFGINISRNRSNRSLYLTILMAILYLTSFFVAKGLDRNWALATALYLIPPVLMILASVCILRRISRGVE